MKDLKKYGVCLLFLMIFLLISLSFTTIFHYINVLSAKTSSLFNFIFLLIGTFLCGYKNGKKSTKNGWLEGIKLSALFLLFLNIIDIVFFKTSYDLPFFLFQLLLAFILTFGSMLGINKNIESH